MPNANIHRVGHNPYLNIALVAESGFGKTRLLGTAGARMLILSYDPEGTDSAFFAGSDADEWKIRTFGDMEESYLYCKNRGHAEYDWVAVDSAPEAQKIIQLDWLEKNKANPGKRHPDVLGLDGYQITQNQLIKYVKQMNDLKMHTVYTAKPLELTDAEGEIYYLPNLHGQRGDIARDFMGYMKIQGFGTYYNKRVKTTKGEIEEREVRRWYFSPKTPYRGKDRTDALGEFLDDPTLPDIAERVRLKAAEATGSAAARNKTSTTRRRATKRA